MANKHLVRFLEEFKTRKNVLKLSDIYLQKKIIEILKLGYTYNNNGREVGENKIPMNDLLIMSPHSPLSDVWRILPILSIFPTASITFPTDCKSEDFSKMRGKSFEFIKSMGIYSQLF